LSLGRPLLPLPLSPTPGALDLTSQLISQSEVSPFRTKKGTTMTVATIAGANEVDRGVAKLVLAFCTDPIARWMYDDPHQYLLRIPRLFRALGAGSFEAGAAQRTSDGLGVALWLPPGIHGDDGELEAVIAESMAGEKQAEVGRVFERTEHYRPAEPHWYLTLIGVEALHRNKGSGATLLQHGLRHCDREHRPAYLWSSNLLNTSLYQRHGFEIMDEIQVGSSPSIFPMLRQAR
jgi:GNAT superfamily N-acetyltransferase